MMKVRDFLDQIHDEASRAGVLIDDYDLRVSLDADDWDVAYEEPFDMAHIEIGGNTVWLTPPPLENWRSDYDQALREMAVEGIVLEAIAAALSKNVEVNGGELESVLTIYKPEGLAVMVLEHLKSEGVRMVTPPPSTDDRKVSR